MSNGRELQRSLRALRQRTSWMGVVPVVSYGVALASAAASWGRQDSSLDSAVGPFMAAYALAAAVWSGWRLRPAPAASPAYRAETASNGDGRRVPCG